MAEVPREVIWLVSAVLVEAAVIDGLQLRVPNWLNFHFLLGGLAFALWWGGPGHLSWALQGAGLGILTLLPLYAIGGMGAGDVKLMAGMGAWVGPGATLGAFLATGVVGGLMALAMVAHAGEFQRFLSRIQLIGGELITIRDPAILSARAAERKKSMMLLPYGIPIAVGSIAYFLWSGLLR